MRIAITKSAVDSDNLSGFHAKVVWVLQLGPALAPFVAYLVASSSGIQIFSDLLFIMLLLLGAYLFRIVALRCNTELRRDSPAAGSAGSVLEQFTFTLSHIANNPALRLSTLIASLQNVVVFSSIYVSTHQYLSLPKGSGATATLPLAVAGVGAMFGAMLPKRFPEFENNHSNVWMIFFASQILLCIQALLVPGLLLLTTIFLISALGAVIAVVVWGIRLNESPAHLVGSVAGITSMAYKVPSILLLPIIGWLLDGYGRVFAMGFTVAVLTISPIGLVIAARREKKYQLGKRDKS